jgi:hypothetical protein
MGLGKFVASSQVSVAGLYTSTLDDIVPLENPPITYILSLITAVAGLNLTVGSPCFDSHVFVAGS